MPERQTLEVFLSLQNPQILQRIEQLRSNPDYTVNLKANIDKGLQRFLGIGPSGLTREISIVVKSSDALSTINKLEQRFKELQKLARIEIQVPSKIALATSGVPGTEIPQLRQRIFQQRLEFAKAQELEPELRRILGTQRPLGTFAAFNTAANQRELLNEAERIRTAREQSRQFSQLRRRDVIENVTQQAVRNVQQGFEPTAQEGRVRQFFERRAANPNLPAEERLRALQVLRELNRPVEREFDRQRRLAQAQRQFNLEGAVFSDLQREERARALGIRFRLTTQQIAQLQQTPTPFLDARRITGRAAALELGFAGLFGGFPGFVGGAVGGAIGGPGGIFFGSAAIQIARQRFEAIFDTIKNSLLSAADAGQEFQKSISTITGALVNTTQFIGRNGLPLPIQQQIRLQTQEARAIQQQARSALVPLGFGGQSEQALVQSIITGTTQRGIVLNARQFRTVAERLGATLATLEPESLNEPSRILRTLPDILLGQPRAQASEIGALLKNIAPELFGKFRTAEELVKVTEKLETFVNTLKNLDQASIQLLKLSGSIDTLKVAVGDKFLTTITPAINILIETLSKNDLKEALSNIARDLGNFINFIVNKAVEIGNATPEFFKQRRVQTEGLLFGQFIGPFGPLVAERATQGRFVEELARGIPSGINFLEELQGGRFFENRQQNQQNIRLRIERRTQDVLARLRSTRVARSTALATNALAELAESERIGEIEKRTVSTRLPVGEIKSSNLEIARLRNEISLLEKVVKNTQDPLRKEYELRLQGKQVLLEEAQVRNRLATINQQLLQIDQETFQGRFQALGLTRQQALEGGVSPDVALTQEARGRQQVNLDIIQSTRELSLAFMALSNISQETTLRQRELGREIAELNLQLRDLNSQQRIRRLESIDRQLGLREQIIQTATDLFKGQGIEEEQARRFAELEVPLNALSINPQAALRNRLDLLKQQFELGETQNEERRVREREARELDALNDKLAAARLALDKLRLETDNARIAFSTLVLNLEKQFAGDTSPLANLIRQLGDVARQTLSNVARNLGINVRPGDLSSEPNLPAGLSLGEFIKYKKLGFAKGGVFPVNEPIIVGEEGPEMIIPTSSGLIIPNDVLADIGVYDLHDERVLDRYGTFKKLRKKKKFLDFIKKHGFQAGLAVAQEGGEIVDDFDMRLQEQIQRALAPTEGVPETLGIDIPISFFGRTRSGIYDTPSASETLRSGASFGSGSFSFTGTPTNVNIVSASPGGFFNPLTNIISNQFRNINRTSFDSLPAPLRQAISHTAAFRVGVPGVRAAFSSGNLTELLNNPVSKRFELQQVRSFINLQQSRNQVANQFEQRFDKLTDSFDRFGKFVEQLNNPSNFNQQVLANELGMMRALQRSFAGF